MIKNNIHSMLNFTDEQFKEIKDKAEEFYKSLSEVNCPYLKEKVVFNSKGLEHLKFSRKNHARPRSDQYIRFRLLNLVPRILGLSHTIQGISRAKGFELIRSNAKNQMILKEILYYEFVAVIDNVRVRVVVKQIENGQKYFWSVIPFWKIDKDKKQRRMNYGNPEID